MAALGAADRAAAERAGRLPRRRRAAVEGKPRQVNYSSTLPPKGGLRVRRRLEGEHQHS